MEFLWNGYGFMILKNMDYGMDMDLVPNPFGPTDCVYTIGVLKYTDSEHIQLS